MFSLSQIEDDLKDAMKAKDQLRADVLRGLKTRITNGRIAKMKDLDEDELTALVRSEVKKRKEAAESFAAGGRQELADKELKEIRVLDKYLPAQMGEEELVKLIEKTLAENQFTAQDFGKAMSMPKARTGASADGAVLAKFLKEKLK